MTKTLLPIADNPKAALADYIHQLEGIYYPWFEKDQKRYKRRWQVLQTLTVVAGFGTSAIAALMQEEHFKRLEWGWIVLVVLPFIGGLASTLLTQSRPFEFMALRERGRETIQYLLALAKKKYAESKKPKDISKFHQWLVHEVSHLEQSQATGFLKLTLERGTHPPQNQQPGKLGVKKGT